MFNQAIEIASIDPLTGEAVRAKLTPEGEGTWEPESGAIVAGIIDRSDESFRGCCPALNFFESPESGERWLNDQHGGARGHVVSMPDAIAAGRAVFGDVFR
jgi:Alkylmercury lyase